MKERIEKFKDSDYESIDDFLLHLEDYFKVKPYFTKKTITKSKRSDSFYRMQIDFGGDIHITNNGPDFTEVIENYKFLQNEFAVIARRIENQYENVVVSFHSIENTIFIIFEVVGVRIDIEHEETIDKLKKEAEYYRKLCADEKARANEMERHFRQIAESHGKFYDIDKNWRKYDYFR